MVIILYSKYQSFLLLLKCLADSNNWFYLFYQITCRSIGRINLLIIRLLPKGLYCMNFCWKVAIVLKLYRALQY